MKKILILVTVILTSACSSTTKNQSACLLKTTHAVTNKHLKHIKTSSRMNLQPSKQQVKYSVSQNCKPEVLDNRLFSVFKIKATISINEKTGPVGTIAFKASAQLQRARGILKTEYGKVRLEMRVTKKNLIVIDIPSDLQLSRSFTIYVIAIPVYRYERVITTKGFILAQNISGKDKVSIINILNERSQKCLTRQPGLIRKR